MRTLIYGILRSVVWAGYKVPGLPKALIKYSGTSNYGHSN
jgi:hypothetical protein